MAYIPSYQTLREHPKLKRLARRLSISEVTAIGHLHLLWWWGVDYAPAGSLSGHDALDIAIAGRWDGDENEFVDALIDSGFVDYAQDGTRALHDWDEYAGQYQEKLEKDRERKRTARRLARETTDSPGTSGGHQGLSEGRPPEIQGTARQEEESKGEKRKEEESTETPPLVPQAQTDPGQSVSIPKPRSEKQLAADAIYERKMLIVAAYFRGLGVEEGTLGWTTRKPTALATLTAPILASPECVPEIIEPLARYTKAAFGWRNGKKTPLLTEVLAAFAEWDAENRPEHPPPKQFANRSSTAERPTRNGRVGYTLDELKRLSEGDYSEPKPDNETTHDAGFRVVR